MGVPTAPTMAPIGDVYGNSFDVSWSSHDTLNPAINYELKEFTGLQRITDNLDVNSDNWTLHNFTRSSARHHSGSYSLFSGAQNSYTASASLNNPVTIALDDTLKFWTWYYIEQDYDYAYVQLSTDGGATWINLAGNITTNSNPYGNNLGNGITGMSSNWVQGKFPLNAYAGQSVLLNLLFRTDQGLIYEGFYVDDFYPVETFQQENILGSDIADTFFVVSGRGEGDYYYQVRGRDAQGQWSLFSNREMATVHPGSTCNYIPGDANGNGAANGIDIVFGVNYFKGTGNAPPDTCDCPPSGRVLAAADANGNCAYNGIDITFLVNFLKGTGVAPRICPDCPVLKR